FRERFGISLRRTYGTTEAGHISAETSAASDIRLATVGRPYLGVEVRVGADPSKPRAPGTTGPIWVKSPWRMDGYGLPPRLDPGPILEGWSPTNDVGFVDEDGRLTLLGRSDDSVKLGSGYLVNLTDVAVALGTYPGVTDIAVVSLDTDNGAVIGALVE